MSTEMGGGDIPDCEAPGWHITVAVSNGRVRVEAMGPTPEGIRGGKVFLDQAGARLLMEQLQDAHAYNNWQPYPHLYFD